MLSNHLILCHPLCLLLSIFPSIRIFSNELALHIRWTKYWSFSIRPSYEYSGFPLGLTSLIFFQEYWSAFSFTRGSSPTQGSNPRLLHQQAESLPLSHQRSWVMFETETKQEACRTLQSEEMWLQMGGVGGIGSMGGSSTGKHRQGKYSFFSGRSVPTPISCGWGNSRNL